jgi:formate dehydrogenase iron-sulfur subunit
MDEQKRDTQELVSRRDVLKLTGAGIGGMLLQPTGAVCASGEASSTDAEEHASMLYDATKCVGCKSCEAACKEWNKLPVEPEPPQDLTGNTFTLIKLYQDGDGSDKVFRKYQCMHCLDPACATVCPVAALHKLDWGPVAYDAHKCIGCRYCMAACPFGVPRYDWSQTFPLIRKCTFCADREGGAACAEACPTGALIYGKRGELLEIAKARIAENPGKYTEDRVYGEDEVGGTSVLYLFPVSFDKVGLPELDTRPLPTRTEWALQVVPGIIVGVGGLMSAIYWLTKRRMQIKEG